MALQPIQRLHVILYAAGVLSTCLFFIAVYSRSGLKTLQESALNTKRIVRPYQEDQKAQAIRRLRNFYLTNISDSVRLELAADRVAWQPVSGLGSITFVHAALWLGNNVRILVVKPPKVAETSIFCVLWYTTIHDSNFTIVKAHVVNLPDHHQKDTCAYIKCPVKQIKKKKKNVAPLYVGLTNANNLTAHYSVLIPVENREMDPDKFFKEGISIRQSSQKVSSNASGKVLNKPRVVEFTVCMPAVFQYSNAAQLVEKLEMVRLLGAGRVVLYKTSVKPNVETVLRLYTSEWAAGRETLELVVHSWRQPPPKVHYRGQLGAVDDCLHRYGWLSRYMVFDDLDELIIPLRHANWSQLIAERERLHPGRAAFMFRCSVMNADHSSPADGFRQDAIRYGSSVLSLTQRDDFIFPPADRSKLIVDPRRTNDLAVHYMYRGTKITDVIPVDQGLLYHYRGRPIRLCLPQVSDNRVATIFGERLSARLKAIWSRLKGVALGWLPPPERANSHTPSCKHQS
ncbi:hypothetical protein RRG08_026037 [Elysia crispata]|uniref:Glycosyltransferase family 92 protein n=1 Tax=Elysia crispata TaxID=231223 RepID=A0AAE0YYL9_9GAST|nr:hypothetical protein RRG08_026037 [Elysia crispata]